MAQTELETRVANIEETLRILNTMPERLGGVEGRLGKVEARVGSLETQVLQLGVEMREAFSATRQEFKTDLAATRDELSVQMRVLHENVIARIATLGHGPRRKKR